LAVPANAAWIGIGGKDDQVFAALPDGTLHRADNTRAAASGFTNVARVAGAARWAAANGVIAALEGDRAHVSTDGGAHLRASTVGRGLQPKDLFARADGVLVAQWSDDSGQWVTFVSRAGDRWQKSSFQALELEQTGARIQSTLGSCHRGILAADTT